MRISIITPCRNALATLPRALASVVEQHDPDFEHIVVDGGSNDGTREFLAADQQVRWVSEPDDGQSDAMNKGLSMVSGDFIGFLNADDEYCPETFARLREASRRCRESDVSFVFNLAIRDASGREEIQVPSVNYRDLIDARSLSYPYNPVAYFCPAAVVRRIFPIPGNLHFAMDYWYLLQLYRDWPVRYVDWVAGVFHNYDNKTSCQAQSEIEVADVLLAHLVSHGSLWTRFSLRWLRAWRYRKRWLRAAVTAA